MTTVKTIGVENAVERRPRLRRQPDEIRYVTECASATFGRATHRRRDPAPEALTVQAHRRAHPMGAHTADDGRSRQRARQGRVFLECKKFHVMRSLACAARSCHALEARSNGG